VAWLVKPGDVVKRGQGLMEVMTDKATMEVPSPVPGRVTALKAQPGDRLKIGQVVLTFEGSDGAAASAEARPAAVEARGSNGAVAAPVSARLPVKAAPSVRQLARKLGVDLGGITGTGPEGRVLLEDLTPRFVPPGRETPRPAAEAKPDYGRPGTRIKFQGLRRTIAERLVHAKHTIPHYSYIDECDVTDLVRLRESLRERFTAAGIKLTYLAFFVKAAALALKEVPLVNASLDEAAGEVVLHDRYHLGVAVSTPGGLMVPVVRDADKKDLATIARDLDRLSTEARTGKARRDDLRGSTFTITSIGSIGGLISTPVINHPEVGILGIGKIVRRPVYDDAGQIRPAEMLYLSFSFDHRVVDGAVGAAFGNAVLKQLRSPAALLLPEKW
jgi:pyruvate dehydrogenase E2 component (dihydrolipoamide acetyltransferase)/2-oxoisovalerate dehydrogenase E2 component (dihydrolipoyl transacylase)